MLHGLEVEQRFQRFPQVNGTGRHLVVPEGIAIGEVHLEQLRRARQEGNGFRRVLARHLGVREVHRHAHVLHRDFLAHGEGLAHRGDGQVLAGIARLVGNRHVDVRRCILGDGLDGGNDRVPVGGVIHMEGIVKAVGIEAQGDGVRAKGAGNIHGLAAFINRRVARLLVLVAKA